MTAISHRGNSLDKIDKRILLALDDDVLSAKEICDEWALPESDEARVRYRIRERMGRGEGRLVQIYDAEEVPGGVNDRNLYSLTREGEEFVRSTREALATPESIDDLRGDLKDVQAEAVDAGESAEDAMGVATSQRERVNDLQRDKHTINDRSKENRKRLTELEREVFEDEWGEPSLRELLDQIEEASINRVEDVRHDVKRAEQNARREYAKADDLNEVQTTSQRNSKRTKNLAERVNELESELEQEQSRNDDLERRVAQLERLVQSSGGGLKGLFYD
jgi:chromosome segregation ATPase